MAADLFRQRSGCEIEEGAFSAFCVALDPFTRNVVLHGLFPNRAIWNLASPLLT
jgi:hypothetical protein